MSFAFHSSGERDEETGEYVKPSKWDKEFKDSCDKHFGPNEVEENATHQFAPLPVEFTSEYYDEKLSQYDKTSPNYWEWVKLKLYARVVLKLLAQTSIVTKNSLGLSEANFEPFINFDAKSLRLDDLLKDLDAAERNVSSQFYKYNRTLQAKYNKYPALNRVRMCGAKARLMLENINGNVPLRAMLNYTRAYQNYDFQKDEDILKAYRGYVVLRRSISQKLTPKILTSAVYDGLDVKAIFNELCWQFGAFNMEDLINIRRNLSEDLERLKEDENYADLIKFYSSYDEIYKTMIDLRNLANEFFRAQDNNNYVLDESGYNNLFNVAVGYLNFIKKLKMQTNLPEVISKDLSYLKGFAADSIDFAFSLHMPLSYGNFG